MQMYTQIVNADLWLTGNCEQLVMGIGLAKANAMEYMALLSGNCQFDFEIGEIVGELQDGKSVLEFNVIITLRFNAFRANFMNRHIESKFDSIIWDAFTGGFPGETMVGGGEVSFAVERNG